MSRRKPKPAPLPSILIDVGNGSSEAVVAEMIAPGFYKVLSVPVFCGTVHFGDLVRCSDDDPEKIPKYLETVTAADSITAQIVFVKPTPTSVNIVLRALAAAGVHVERAAGQLYLASVPRERYEEVELLLDDYPRATLRWWQQQEDR